MQRFIDTLVFFPSAKIDRAVRKVLHSTEEDYLAVACARYLVGRGADADIRQYVEKRLKGANENRRKKLERLRERLGWTLLHVAAEMDEPNKIKTLILKGDPNARLPTDQTPLHVAAEHGSFGAIRVLLAAKANPNIKDKQGRDPAQLGNDSALDLLLAGGAEPSDIFVASTRGVPTWSKASCQRTRPWWVRGESSGDTPLHFACPTRPR